MLLLSLILIPLVGIFLISSLISYDLSNNSKLLRFIALAITTIDLIVSLLLWILYDGSNKYYQFVQEHYVIGHYDFYLGVDGISIYFVLLTTLIMPISIISNWKSIQQDNIYFLIIFLLLETLLLTIFLVLDILMFYIFFESILAPLFILIGLFGSNEKIRAGFYFFLYTFLGSLFMLLSIITMLSLTGCTDFYILSKTNFEYTTQLFMFIGIFIAFSVKTPVIYLNGWLLKAHVESPLSGSIVLAAIVLKLSLYGIFRLILPILPKAFISCTHIIFVIGVITIIYASLSTLRTVDVKELIAYSSVSHAAVYFAGVFSNTLHGIVGGIGLGLAHGFVSSGLFICAGGVLYDRSSTRLITYYKGITQAMPIFSIVFFILCLGNCGAPLTLNFVGEFMSLYGVFERIPLAGVFASSSIVFSAAFTIFMFNRISFGGVFNVSNWLTYIPDLNKREYAMLLVLVLFTVILGIYPSIIFDGLHYSVYSLLYTIDCSTTHDIVYETMPTMPKPVEVIKQGPPKDITGAVLLVSTCFLFLIHTLMDAVQQVVPQDIPHVEEMFSLPAPLIKPEQLLGMKLAMLTSSLGTTMGAAALSSLAQGLDGIYILIFHGEEQHIFILTLNSHLVFQVHTFVTINSATTSEQLANYTTHLLNTISALKATMGLSFNIKFNIFCMGSGQGVVEFLTAPDPFFPFVSLLATESCSLLAHVYSMPDIFLYLEDIRNNLASISGFIGLLTVKGEHFAEMLVSIPNPDLADDTWSDLKATTQLLRYMEKIHRAYADINAVDSFFTIMMEQ